MGEFLTTAEVAAYLKRSKSWVDQQCRSGKIPYETLGQTRMIRRRDVENLKGAPKSKPGPKPQAKKPKRRKGQRS